MPRRALILVFFGVLAIGMAAAAGCGGGGSKSDATTTNTPSSAGGTPTAEQTSLPASRTATPSGASGDSAAIEAVVRAQATANNNKDIDGFVAAFSDSYLTDKLHVTRQQARDLVATFIGEPRIEITKVSQISISGDSATAQVDKNGGVIVKRQRYSFAREAGQWRIAGTDDLPVSVPSSTRTVELKLEEYRYVFDPNAVADGSFAFHVTNAGAQEHEVQLKRLPDGVTAQQLERPQDTPAGVETIGLFGPLKSGETRPIVFAGPLTPGRYAMVSYLADASGELDSQLGMVAEFTVQ